MAAGRDINNAQLGKRPACVSQLSNRANSPRPRAAVVQRSGAQRRDGWSRGRPSRTESGGQSAIQRRPHGCPGSVTVHPGCSPPTCFHFPERWRLPQCRLTGAPCAAQFGIDGEAARGAALWGSAHSSSSLSEPFRTQAAQSGRAILHFHSPANSRAPHICTDSTAPRTGPPIHSSCRSKASQLATYLLRPAVRLRVRLERGPGTRGRTRRSRLFADVFFETWRFPSPHPKTPDQPLLMVRNTHPMRTVRTFIARAERKDRSAAPASMRGIRNAYLPQVRSSIRTASPPRLAGIAYRALGERPPDSRRRHSESAAARDCCSKRDCPAPTISPAGLRGLNESSVVGSGSRGSDACTGTPRARTLGSAATVSRLPSAPRARLVYRPWSRLPTLLARSASRPARSTSVTRCGPPLPASACGELAFPARLGATSGELSPGLPQHEVVHADDLMGAAMGDSRCVRWIRRYARRRSVRAGGAGELPRSTRTLRLGVQTRLTIRPCRSASAASTTSSSARSRPRPRGASSATRRRHHQRSRFSVRARRSRSTKRRNRRAASPPSAEEDLEGSASPPPVGSSESPDKSEDAAEVPKEAEGGQRESHRVCGLGRWMLTRC